MKQAFNNYRRENRLTARQEDEDADTETKKGLSLSFMRIMMSPLIRKGFAGFLQNEFLHCRDAHRKGDGCDEYDFDEDSGELPEWVLHAFEPAPT